MVLEVYIKLQKFGQNDEGKRIIGHTYKNHALGLSIIRRF